MIFGRRCGETRRLKSAIENEGPQDALRGAAITAFGGGAITREQIGRQTEKCKTEK
jgi:hypothetical protein